MVVMVLLVSILFQIHAYNDIAPTSFVPNSSPPIALPDFPKLDTTSSEGPMGDCLKKRVKRCRYLKKLGGPGKLPFDLCILYNFS